MNISDPTNFKHIAHIGWDPTNKTYVTTDNKSFEEIFNIKDKKIMKEIIEIYSKDNNEEQTLKSDSENDTHKEDENVDIREISHPSNFYHVSHISWGPNKDFEMKTNDEELANFFRQAGVTKEHLQDRNTREFIFQFIQKHCEKLEMRSVNVEPFIGYPTEFCHITKCIYNKNKEIYDVETKDKHLSWFYERAQLLKKELEKNNVKEE